MHHLDLLGALNEATSGKPMAQTWLSSLVHEAPRGTTCTAAFKPGDVRSDFLGSAKTGLPTSPGAAPHINLHETLAPQTLL